MCYRFSVNKYVCNGSIIRVHGVATVPLVTDSCKSKFTALVSDHVHEVMLGIDFFHVTRRHRISRIVWFHSMDICILLSMTLHLASGRDVSSCCLMFGSPLVQRIICRVKLS